MGILDKFEKAVDDALKKLGRHGRRREPLEVGRAIVAEVESKITPLGGGRRVFPFGRLTVQLYAPDAEARALYDAAFVGNRALAKLIGEQLRPPRCEVPSNLNVSVVVVEDADVEWATEGFKVTYEGAAPAPASDNGDKKAKAQLVVMHGKAQKAKYQITKRRTNIGRQAEVLDNDGLPLRRNDLAFDDGGGEVNETVSRVHAHIQFNKETGEYRLHDDNSAYGTLIIRADGRRVKVTRGLGAPLQPGDEIYFGQARVLFKNDG